MLDKATQEKILESVRSKPRTIQEVAHIIDHNWRTADSYVERIATETGLISTRTFREGTRGALKIIFWNALEGMKGSAYQERLLQRIVQGKRKHDFSPFDIYQFVDTKKRNVFIQTDEFADSGPTKYDSLLGAAKTQILFFSGNLSWAESAPNALHTVEELAKKGVKMKMLSRVDITSVKTTQELLAINTRLGKDLIEIRHCEQPLRCTLIDDSLASIKEVFTPLRHPEIKHNTFLIYKVTDTEWVSWLQKVFWHLWQQSIDARTRLATLEDMRAALD